MSTDRIEPHQGQQSYSSITKKLCLEEIISYSFRWTISNFSRLHRHSRNSLLSSVFPTGEKDKHKWQMKVYKKDQNVDNKDFLSVIVYLESIGIDVTLPVKANYMISIINSTNHDMNVDVGGQVEFNTLHDNWGSRKCIHEDILLNPASGMLPGDKLTLTCKIDVFTGKFTEAPIKRCQVLNDLGAIFETRLLSDVNIVVAGREFKAHKAILAARSPVFRAMFSHDMQENQLSRVEVNDVEPDVFEQLLRYIYTGNSTRLESTIDGITEESSKKNANRYSLAIDLFMAACKYQLDDLKLTCERHLHKLLTVDSVVEILFLVDQYQPVWLKDRAVEFAIAHGKELSRNGALKVLAKQSPEILADILAKQWSDTS